MKIIKFRGKTLDDKEWVYGYYIITFGKFPQISLENGDLIHVDSKTVGQYIGLKDKTGKEIYSGDIIDARQECGGLHVVKWMRIEHGIGFSINCSGTSGMEILEVIGNDIDNPDLL